MQNTCLLSVCKIILSFDFKVNYDPDCFTHQLMFVCLYYYYYFIAFYYCCGFWFKFEKSDWSLL